MSLRLAHAMIAVRELEAAIAFYEHALGLRVAERHSYEDAELAYIRAPDGGAELELLSERPWRFAGSPEKGRNHVAFTVTDVDREHERLAALGIDCGPVTDYVANGRLQTRFFYLYDPEGNEIEILEAMGRYHDKGDP